MLSPATKLCLTFPSKQSALYLATAFKVYHEIKTNRLDDFLKKLRVGAGPPSHFPGMCTVPGHGAGPMLQTFPREASGFSAPSRATLTALESSASLSSSDPLPTSVTSPSTWNGQMLSANLELLTSIPSDPTLPSVTSNLTWLAKASLQAALAAKDELA